MFKTWVYCWNIQDIDLKERRLLDVEEKVDWDDDWQITARGLEPG